MEREPSIPVGRRIDVESVLAPEQRRDESELQDFEEREPVMNVSAPLRYSQSNREETGNGSRGTETQASSDSSLAEDNVRPL
jgi:hypothetical protein